MIQSSLCHVVALSLTHRLYINIQHIYIWLVQLHLTECEVLFSLILLITQGFRRSSCKQRPGPVNAHFNAPVLFPSRWSSAEQLLLGNQGNLWWLKMWRWLHLRPTRSTSRSAAPGGIRPHVIVDMYILSIYHNTVWWTSTCLYRLLPQACATQTGSTCTGLERGWGLDLFR